MLRVGRVSYKNTIPLFYKLSGFEVIEGVPSHLVKLLREGKIDAGIVSSAEYFFNPDKYLILPDISISSRGRVCSVKLFSKVPLEDIRSVRLSDASLTSRYLLFYIFEERLGYLPEESEDAEAVMLIGDEALEVKEFPYTYDLAEEWFKIHGLPFVFALFLVRREARTEEVKRLYKGVKESLKEFFKDLAEGEVSKDFYFTECIDYSLKEEHIKSLRLFFEYLGKRFKKPVPDFEFFKGI
ncbi:menaquinone biosynthesis protein [Aquifex sp.]